MSNKILVLDHSVYDYGKAVEGLGELTCKLSDFVKHTKEFKLVLFTGGADVDPSFYDDTSPQNMCMSSPQRDAMEKDVFLHALSNKIPMIGICRGLQFLNVMAKGRMMHHMSGHGGSIHLFDSPTLATPISVNSFHHQMIIPHEDSYIIGWTPDNLSKHYYGKNDQHEEWYTPEVESAIFPSINACGVQYHPEWMADNSEGAQFFFNMADRLIETPIDEFVQHYTKRVDDVEQKSTDVCARTSSAT